MTVQPCGSRPMMGSYGTTFAVDDQQHPTESVVVVHDVIKAAVMFENTNQHQEA